MRQSYAPVQKIGVQALRLLTIWAWQNLQLLTSSKSGWRALVQVMLPLVHVVLKWPEDSGRPAYMGGVSPVLYRLLCRHDLSKYLRFVQISAGAYIFTVFTLCFSFSYLRSAVEASFDYKKACGKPYSFGINFLGSYHPLIYFKIS